MGKTGRLKLGHFSSRVKFGPCGSDQMEWRMEHKKESLLSVVNGKKRKHRKSKGINRAISTLQMKNVDNEETVESPVRESGNHKKRKLGAKKIARDEVTEKCHRRTKLGAVTTHPFETDYGDHFETPQVAYQHLSPALHKLAQKLRKQPAELRIYDPFFCEGSVVKRLRTLGFPCVIHQNRDFWALRKEQLPEYDILVTNPPFSGDHKERILNFCVKSHKPWALLMPNYVATKSYYTLCLNRVLPFYIAPLQKYQYTHPEGTGHSDSPFESFWFVLVAKRQEEQEAAAVEIEYSNATAFQVHKNVEALRKCRLVPTVKRKNPKQRRKEKARVQAIEISTRVKNSSGR